MAQRGEIAPQPARTAEKIEPLSVPSIPDVRQAPQDDRQKTDFNLNKAQNLIDEYQREEKSGFQLGDEKKGKSTSEQDLAGKSRDKKSAEDDDNYDEDFDEIEEDLPEGGNDDYVDDQVARSANNVGGSGQGITVS